MEQSKKIALLGSNGALGLALARALEESEFNISFVDRSICDVQDGGALAKTLLDLQPSLVINTAAFIRGVGARDQMPYSVLAKNLQISLAVMEACRSSGISRLLQFGSSQARSGSPRYSTGDPSSAKERIGTTAYGLAKEVQTQAAHFSNFEFGTRFKEIQLPNLFGPSDRFDLEMGHVVSSALLRVGQWLTNDEHEVSLPYQGEAERVFAYTPDVAKWIAQNIRDFDVWPDAFSLGVGEPSTISEVYETAARILGFEGHINFEGVNEERASCRSNPQLFLGRQRVPTTSLLQGMSVMARERRAK